MLFRARLGTFTTFALAGLLCGVWVSRMPALAGKFGVSKGEVGVVLLVWGLFAIVAMQGLRTAMARFGSRTMLRWALPLTAVSFAGVALAPSFPAVLVAAAAFGMTFGIVDIAMNAQGAVVENAYRRPVLNGMHAGWCLGGMSGGLIGVGTAAAGLGHTGTLLATAVFALPVGLLLGRTYLPDPVAPAAASGKGRARLPLVVYLVGALAFIAFMAEGTIADWSGMLLSGEMGASEAVAALAYPVFELAMLLGRLVGDHARVRLGTRALLMGSGIGTALGMTVVVMSPNAFVALGGFFFTGLMVCTIVPTTMSLAGTAAPGQPAAAVAQVGAMGYGGLLLGPVVVGFLADASSLRVGVGTVIGLALLLTVGVRFLPLGAGHDVAAQVVGDESDAVLLSPEARPVAA